MALGPDKFKDILDNTLKSFETFIDEKISAHKMKQNDTCIYIDGPKGITERHFLMLKQKYLDLGWYNLEFYGGTLTKIRFDLTPH